MTCTSRVRKSLLIWTPQRNVHHTQIVPDEVKPQQVCIWSSLGEVLRVYSVLKRNRSKPREGISHTRYNITKDHQGSPEAHKKDSGTQ